MLCLKCSIYTEVLSAIPQWKDRQVLFRELSLPHLAFCLPCPPPPPLLLTFSMFVWLAGSKSVSFLYHATIYLYIFIIFNSCNFHDTLILGALWITNFIKLIVSQCRTIHKVILNPREFSQTVIVVQSIFVWGDVYVTELVRTCTFFIFQIDFTLTCVT